MSESNALNKTERLVELEKVIARQTFKQRGNALAEICDNKLYIPEFPDFDMYCGSRWGFRGGYGYRLIAAAKVAEELSPIGEIAKESHARELARLPKERREAVFRDALLKAQSAGRKLWASDFKETANSQNAPVIPKPRSVETKLRALWAKASEEERTSFRRWIEVMDAEIERATNVECKEDNERKYRCNACGETFEDDDEAVSLYECCGCGIQFTANASANGNHQCGECNRFASKISERGCPICDEGELEELEGGTR